MMQLPEFLERAVTGQMHEGLYVPERLLDQFAEERNLDNPVGFDELNMTLSQFVPGDVNDDDFKLDEVFNEINASPVSMFLIFIQVVGAHQSKRLNADNVASFFASKDMDLRPSNFLMRVLTVCANTMGKILDSDMIVYLSEESAWIMYHTTTFSAAKLALKLYDAYPDLAPSIFSLSRNSMEAISLLSHDMRASSLVSDSGKVALYAFLEANEALPRNWYQGRKAWDSAPILTRNKWTAFFAGEAAKANAGRYDREKSAAENLDLLGLLNRDPALAEADAQAVAERLRVLRDDLKMPEVEIVLPRPRAMRRGDYQMVYHNLRNNLILDDQKFFPDDQKDAAFLAEAKANFEDEVRRATVEEAGTVLFIIEDMPDTKEPYFHQAGERYARMGARMILESQRHGMGTAGTVLRMVGEGLILAQTPDDARFMIGINWNLETMEFTREIARTVAEARERFTANSVFVIGSDQVLPDVDVVEADVVIEFDDHMLILKNIINDVRRRNGLDAPDVADPPVAPQDEE
jgi:hypothetical protein